jgi:hypothetical protein
MTRCRKALLAHIAFVRFLSGVHSRVISQITSLSKALLAGFTLVRFLSGVNTHVYDQTKPMMDLHTSSRERRARSLSSSSRLFHPKKSVQKSFLLLLASQRLPRESACAKILPRVFLFFFSFSLHSQSRYRAPPRRRRRNRFHILRCSFRMFILTSHRYCSQFFSLSFGARAFTKRRKGKRKKRELRSRIENAFFSSFFFCLGFHQRKKNRVSFSHLPSPDLSLAFIFRTRKHTHIYNK